MIRVDTSIETVAPIDRVWAYLSDPNNQLELSPNFLAMETGPDGPPALGVKFRGRLRVFGVVNFTIDQFDAGRMFRVAADPWLGLLTHQFELASANGNTKVAHFVELEPAGMARLAAPILRLAIKFMLTDLNGHMVKRLNRLASEE